MNHGVNVEAMNHVNCAVCGQKLAEGETGSRIRIKCARCGRLWLVRIADGGVSLTAVEKKNPPKRADGCRAERS